MKQHLGLPRLERAGLDAWLIRIDAQLDERNIARLQALAQACEQAFAGQLIEVVPSYTSLLVQYDCLQLEGEQVRQRLLQLLAQLPEQAHKYPGVTHELPIWYDPQVGPDLPRLEQDSGLDWQQLVERHARHSYSVFALGFAPGFAFMGLLPPELRFPRLDSPRRLVPANSLGVAEQQTAIYPSASPGGWNLIGRSCTPLFDPEQQPPSRLQIGDRVQFQPLSKAEFLRLGGNPEPL